MSLSGVDGLNKAQVSEDSCNSKLYENLKLEIENFVDTYLPDPSEITKEDKGEKVIRDGLWGTLKLHPWEICFIDTPLFQRLRQIHQTGLTFYTYPTTTHSRF